MNTQLGATREIAFTRLAVAVVMISSVIFVLPTIGVWQESDYIHHLLWAKQLSETTKNINGHTAYQQLTIIFRAIIPFNLLKVLGNQFDSLWPKFSCEIAGLLVVILFNNCLVLLIFNRVKNQYSYLSKKALLLLCFFVPLALVLISPVSIFTFPQRNLYMGYIGISVYHIPTIILLKTTSVLLFWLILDRFATKETTLVQVIGIGFATILNVMAKPNYIISFAPIICLMAIIRSFQKKEVNWKLIVFGLVLPGTIVLLFQYATTYLAGYEGGIVVAPFEVARNYVQTTSGIILRLVLSIAFPLAVVLLFRKRIFQNHAMVAAYATLLVNILFMYLLKESGSRMQHGNFWWGAQVALLIVMIESLLFCVHEFSAQIFPKLVRNYKFWIASGVFCLHLISGIAWFGVLALGKVHFF